jgi:hypothetical protein
MIVYGWNHFKIKSFKPHELGIGKENETDLTIERRQKYFHLFWIPFFGIGKMWAIRKNDKLLQMPEGTEDHLSSLNLRLRTPWYTYAGPLLILAGILIYSISESVDDYKSKVYAENQFEAKMLSFNNFIDHPSKVDFYHFEEINDYSNNVFMKVADFNDKAIKFQLSQGEIEHYASTPGEISPGFSKTPDSTDFIWINKSDLKKYISTRYSDQQFEGWAFPKKKKSSHYKLDDIFHFEGEDAKGLVDYGIGYVYQNEISMGFTNKGLPISLVSIKNLSGDIQWTSELPMAIDSNEAFKIYGKCTSREPAYKLELICKDENKQVIRYQVEGQGIERTLTKID